MAAKYIFCPAPVPSIKAIQLLVIKWLIFVCSIKTYFGWRGHVSQREPLYEREQNKRKTLRKAIQIYSVD